MAGPTPPPQDLSQRILNSVDVKWMAVETPTGRREFVIAGGPPAGVESIIADDNSYLESMAATFHALFAAPRTVVKLSAPAQANEPAIEFAFDETTLVQSLRRVSYNFLTISLTIAAVVTCVFVGGAVAHGASAGAPAHVQHHRLRRESPGRVAGDRADRAGKRDRPRRGGARRHAGVARP